MSVTVFEYNGLALNRQLGQWSLFAHQNRPYLTVCLHMDWREETRRKATLSESCMMVSVHGNAFRIICPFMLRIHQCRLYILTHGDVIKWIFRVTGPLWGKSTGQPWIHLTKSNEAELWCLFYLRLNKQLSKSLNNQSRCRWFETPSRSLWRHSNPKGPVIHNFEVSCFVNLKILLKNGWVVSDVRRDDVHMTSVLCVTLSRSHRLKAFI